MDKEETKFRMSHTPKECAQMSFIEYCVPVTKSIKKKCIYFESVHELFTVDPKISAFNQLVINEIEKL